MAIKVRTNRYHGQPGKSSFKCKLPKGITRVSISFVLDLIFNAHETVPEGIASTDFYVGELSQVYPELNIEICRHFVLVGESERQNQSNVSEPINDDNSSIVSIPSSDNEAPRNCLMCDLKCTDGKKICMKCKCVNQRIDQLSMDVKQIKHTIEAILDNDDPCSSNTRGRSTRQPVNTQPPPPGTSHLPTDLQQMPPSNPRPRNTPTPASSQPTSIPAMQPQPQHISPPNPYPRNAPTPAPPQPPAPQPPFPALQPQRSLPYPLQPRPIPFSNIYQQRYLPPGTNYPPPNFSMPNRPPRSTYQGRSYASVARAPPQFYNSTTYASGCEYCGEPNHRAVKCKHGMQLQCRRCSLFGHKERLCPY